MSLAHATEQTLDSMVEGKGKKWANEYREKFARLVAEVKAYKPKNTWHTETPTTRSCPYCGRELNTNK